MIDDIEDFVVFSNNNKTRKSNGVSDIYKTMDNETQKTISNKQQFIGFLDVVSKFDVYSVGNCLLIKNQMPNATYLREAQEWKKIDNNAYFNKNSKPITLLKPTKNEKGYNNGFIKYEVFDIAQTNLNKTEHNIYNERDLLKSFVHMCPVEIRVVDEITNSKKTAFYNKSEDILYIKRGSEFKYLMKDLSYEYTKLKLDYNDKYYSKFICQSVSYMFCKRYGIDTSEIKIYDLPKNINSKRPSEIRSMLDEVKTPFFNINEKIKEYNTPQKQTKSLEYER